MGKIKKKFLQKYRYLIFLSVYILISALLAFLYVGAISLNIGEEYWHVFKGTYLIIFFLVIIGSAAILFAVHLISNTRVFEGKGGFLALVIAYIVMVAIMEPAIYFGLLNFQGL